MVQHQRIFSAFVVIVLSLAFVCTSVCLGRAEIPGQTEYLNIKVLYVVAPNARVYERRSVWDASLEKTNIQVFIQKKESRTINNLDSAISVMKESVEIAREFYWRNSRMHAHLDVDFIVLNDSLEENIQLKDGITTEISGGWVLAQNTVVAVDSDFDFYGPKKSVIEKKLLAENPDLDLSQYDSLFVYHKGPGGYYGGLGYSRVSSPVLVVADLSWLFVHEFGHSFEGMISRNVPGYTYPAVHPTFWGNYGGDYDCMAYGMRLVPLSYWKNAAKHGTIKTFVDADQDGVPDEGDFPITEEKLGTKIDSVDSDGDGLTDFYEATAGKFQSASGVKKDSDEDGISDLHDRYPTIPVNNIIVKNTPTIDGVLDLNNWTEVFYDTKKGVSLYASWDETGLYLAYSLTDDKDTSLLLDLGNNGKFWGKKNVNSDDSSLPPGVVIKDGRLALEDGTYITKNLDNALPDNVYLNFKNTGDIVDAYMDWGALGLDDILRARGIEAKWKEWTARSLGVAGDGKVMELKISAMDEIDFNPRVNDQYGIQMSISPQGHFSWLWESQSFVTLVLADKSDAQYNIYPAVPVLAPEETEERSVDFSSFDEQHFVMLQEQDLGTVFEVFFSVDNNFTEEYAVRSESPAIVIPTALFKDEWNKNPLPIHWKARAIKKVGDLELVSDDSPVYSLYLYYKWVLPELQYRKDLDTTIFSSEHDFFWDAGQNVSSYRLTVGTAEGISDIFDSGVIFSTQVRAVNLPLDNKLFVRLYAQVGANTWFYKDYCDFQTAKTFRTLPQLIRPIVTVAPETNVVFQWDSSDGVLGRHVFISENPELNFLKPLVSKTVYGGSASIDMRKIQGLSKVIVFVYTKFQNQDVVWQDYQFVVSEKQKENIPPEISLENKYMIQSGVEFVLPVMAGDKDGDALQYEVENLPAGAVFDQTVASLKWTPQDKDLGRHDLIVRVSDGKTIVEKKVGLSVYLDSPRGLYLFDYLGGDHFIGMVDNLEDNPYFPGQPNVFRDAEFNPNGGYYYLDSIGAVHNRMGAPHFGGATFGPDVAIDLEVTPSGQGYYILDEYGAVHVFGDAVYFGGGWTAPKRLAKDMEFITDQNGNIIGYLILLRDGRILSFGETNNVTQGFALPAGDYVSLELTLDGQGGYVLASDGNVFVFGNAPQFASTNGGLFIGKNLYRDLELSYDVDESYQLYANGFYVLDKFGGVHPFGQAKDPHAFNNVYGLAYWPNSDVARKILFVHPDQDVLYDVAEEISVGLANVNQQFKRVSFAKKFPRVPLVFAGIMSFRGSDTAEIRTQFSKADGIEMKIEEEQSKDTETAHVYEEVGYLTVDSGRILDQSGNQIGEAGVIRNHAQQGFNKWHAKKLNYTYNNPVVLMQISTYNGTEPAHMRIYRTGSNFFEYQVEEWSYLDRYHKTEDIVYFVVESGVHVLPDGMILEAGLTNSGSVKASVRYISKFQSAPVFLTMVQSCKERDAVVTRQKNIGLTGFDVFLQEEEASKDKGWHVVEKVGYVAVGR